jgi:hypothetical protein
VLSKPCLAARNLTEGELPCIGSLFITGFGGSATTFVGSWLNRAGFKFNNELHHEELSDVFVSWLSRTDAWRLDGRSRRSDGQGAAIGAGTRDAGPAFDPDFLLRYIRVQQQRSGSALALEHDVLFATGDTGRVAGLSRCLYRRVLVQMRDPLRTIHSYLGISGLVGFLVLADQLLARSGHFAHACALPVAPTEFPTPVMLQHVTTRREWVVYLAHIWWAWNEAAIAAAHDVYQFEHTDLAKICAMAELNVTACLDTPKPPPTNHHRSRAPPVTWEELCAADAGVALRVYELATRVGYRYNTSVISATAGCEATLVK